MSRAKLCWAVILGLCLFTGYFAMPAEDEVRVSSLGAYRLLENSFLRAETLDGVLHRLVYKPMNADQIRPNGWPGPESRDEFGFRTWKEYKKFTYDSPAPNALRYVRSENGLEMSKVLSMEVSTAVLDFSITLTDNGDKPVKDIYRLISGTCVGGIEDEYDENDFLLVPQEDLQFQMKQIVPESGRISIKPGGNVWGLIDRKKKLILLHVIREGVPKEFALVIGDLSEGGRSSVKRYVMQDVLEPFSLNPDEQIAYKYSWELIGGLKGLSSYREGLAMYGCLDTSGHKRGEKAVVTLQFGAAKSLERNIKAVILCPDKNGRKISVAEKSLPVSVSAGSPVEISIPWTVPELPDGTYTVTIDFFEKDVKIGYATCPLVIGGITSAEIMGIVDESLGNIEKAEKTLPYLGGEFPDTLKDMILAEYYGQKVRDELYYDRLESARLFSGQMLDCSRKAQTDAVREKKDPYRRQRRSSVSREKREFCYSKDGMIFDPDGNRLYLNGMMHGPSLLNDTTVDSNIDRMMERIRQNGNTVNILVFWKQMVPSKGEPIDQAYVARLDKYMKRLAEEHVWVDMFIWDGVPKGFSYPSWGNHLMPQETRESYLSVFEFIMNRYKDYKNVVFTNVPCAEPRINPRDPVFRPLWTKFVVERYGSVENADREWQRRGGGQYGITEDERREGVINIPAMMRGMAEWTPRDRDFCDFMAGYFDSLTEDMLSTLKKVDDRHMVFLGLSYGGWPLSAPAYIGRYLFDSRISGTIFDKYIHYYWGPLNYPPEMWWEMFQVYHKKPVFVGEWGSGLYNFSSSLDDWKVDSPGLRQAWGRLTAGFKPAAMYAYSGAEGYMFDKNNRPYTATRDLMQYRNERIANPLTSDPQVLIAADFYRPLDILKAIARVVAYFPQIGVDFDLLNLEDLPKADLSRYKMLMLYTEGFDPAVLKRLSFKCPVFLVGAPMQTPYVSSAGQWAEAGLFFKKSGRFEGGGAPVPRQVEFLSPVGNVGQGTNLSHVFGQYFAAFIPKEELRDNVEILAETENSAVMMRQGNLYWWTDTIGIEVIDLPMNMVPLYPRIRETEKTVLNAMLDAAGIVYSVSPLQITVVNDVAYAYDVMTGEMTIKNMGTVDLPDGAILNVYERFSDCIIFKIAGLQDSGENVVAVRCNSQDISRVVVNGRKVTFTRSDARHVSFSVPHDGCNQWEIQVVFK